MHTLLEILKYILPSLVVFSAVYYIMRQQNQKDYEMRALELKKDYSKEAIPLKLQAYERLLLFCHRINLPELILRLKANNMTAQDLKNAMIISVQKEYEHNLAVQLYTSPKLWDIITLCKNETINLISNSFNPAYDIDTYTNTMIEALKLLKQNPISIANMAIKEEAKIILNV